MSNHYVFTMTFADSEKKNARQVASFFAKDIITSKRKNYL